MKKSLKNHENIIQKSLKNKEKTCFPLQQEAHFFQPLQEHLHKSATIRTTNNAI